MLQALNHTWKNHYFYNASVSKYGSHTLKPTGKNWGACHLQSIQYVFLSEKI